MRISRIQIRNFRNFANLDVRLGEHAVIVGENKIGKSNLLYALRLVLDPSLPDSARKLREEDFWDGLKRPLGKDDRVTISVDLADFEDNESQLAVLAEHLIEPQPMVARLTFVWQPLSGLEGNPKKESDYEFLIYGGDRHENGINYEMRRRMPLEVIPALRDCEGDLARWTRSPLRPLLDKVAGIIERDKLEKLAEGIDKATTEIAKVTEVKNTADSIGEKLKEMVGPAQALETALRFASTDPDKLIRALRLFIDGGKRGISDASLGSANLLYFALKALENEQLVGDGERDHTFLTIEEPEAHLHPTLQRLVFRNYLRSRRAGGGVPEKAATIVMTTHSPHVVSVTPLRDFIALRLDKDGASTEALSTANIELPEEDVADLERYIDVTRGEILFARGVILVEGDAEKFLLPVLAKNQGHDLDELGIVVCSIAGTNFQPYLKLIGPKGLNLPFSALTDYDPQEPKSDGSPSEPLGPSRVVDRMMTVLVDAGTWSATKFDGLLGMASEHGVFLNSHTFEVDLFKCGLAGAFVEAMNTVGTTAPMKDRMKKWAADGSALDADKFLADLDTVGKGRFAQRLAAVLAAGDTTVCPDYITRGIKHVTGQCRRA